MRKEPMNWDKIENTMHRIAAEFRGAFACTINVRHGHNAQGEHIEIVEEYTERFFGSRETSERVLIRVTLIEKGGTRELRCLVLSQEILNREFGDKVLPSLERLAQDLELKLSYSHPQPASFYQSFNTVNSAQKH